MADINQVISLGIGSPASISYFINLGLGVSVSAVVEVTPNPDNATFIAFRDKRVSVGFRDKRVSVEFRDKRE